MKTVDIEAIIRTAGGDGASLPTPARKRTRVFARQRFTMEPDDQGVEHDLDVVVATPSRWKSMSSGKRIRADEFTTLAVGPLVVAIRISR